MPSVSVVIPCYNSECYLKKTIDSVLSQSYKNIELICVDDGSLDRTRDILNSYGDRVSVFEHPDGANKGEYASYNLGIRNSHGEFIALLDHDDVWLPDKIKQQVEFLQYNPTVDLVYTNGYFIDAYDNILTQYFSYDHIETNQPENLLMKNYIIPTATVIRKRIFETSGYFKENILAGDHDLFLRFSEASSLGYIGEKLFLRRVHPRQVSGKRKLREEGFFVLNEALGRYPYSKKIIRKRKASIHYGLGEYDYNHRYYIRGAYHFLLAAIYDFKKGMKGRSIWINLIKKKRNHPAVLENKTDDQGNNGNMHP